MTSLFICPSSFSLVSFVRFCQEELFFWKGNVRCLNGRPTGRHFSCSRSIVYSDASDLGVGGVVKTTRVLFVIVRGLLMKCFPAIFVSLVFP